MLKVAQAKINCWGCDLLAYEWPGEKTEMCGCVSEILVSMFLAKENTSSTSINLFIGSLYTHSNSQSEWPATHSQVTASISERQQQ